MTLPLTYEKRQPGAIDFVERKLPKAASKGSEVDVSTKPSTQSDERVCVQTKNQEAEKQDSLFEELMSLD